MAPLAVFAIEKKEKSFTFVVKKKIYYSFTKNTSTIMKKHFLTLVTVLAVALAGASSLESCTEKETTGGTEQRTTITKTRQTITYEQEKQSGTNVVTPVVRVTFKEGSTMKTETMQPGSRYATFDGIGTSYVTISLSAPNSATLDDNATYYFGGVTVSLKLQGMSANGGQISSTDEKVLFDMPYQAYTGAKLKAGFTSLKTTFTMNADGTVTNLKKTDE